MPASTLSGSPLQQLYTCVCKELSMLSDVTLRGKSNSSGSHTCAMEPIAGAMPHAPSWPVSGYLGTCSGTVPHSSHYIKTFLVPHLPLLAQAFPVLVHITFYHAQDTVVFRFKYWW
jgi:hypothetical protein